MNPKREPAALALLLPVLVGKSHLRCSLKNFSGSCTRSCSPPPCRPRAGRCYKPSEKHAWATGAHGGFPTPTSLSCSFIFFSREAMEWEMSFSSSCLWKGSTSRREKGMRKKLGRQQCVVIAFYPSNTILLCDLGEVTSPLRFLFHKQQRVIA